MKKEEAVKKAEELIPLLGGIDNVLDVSGCATRIKIKLGSRHLVNREGIENIEWIKGMFENNGFLNIIVGAGNAFGLANALIALIPPKPAKQAEQEGGGRSCSPGEDMSENEVYPWQDPDTLGWNAPGYKKGKAPEHAVPRDARHIAQKLEGQKQGIVATLSMVPVSYGGVLMAGKPVKSTCTPGCEEECLHRFRALSETIISLFIPVLRDGNVKITYTCSFIPESGEVINWMLFDASLLDT